MIEEFKELLAAVRERNLRSKTEPNPAGVLLILEEYQDIRAAGDKEQRAELDNLLGRIVRMGRAVKFHILISTQRPSVDDVPSGVRNLLDQRGILMTRNGQDASLVLGHSPTLPLPTRRGDAIVALPGRDAAVTVDYLSDEDWEALCKRAAKLRKQKPAAEPEPPTIEQEQRQPADPLLAAVLPLLPASATELLAALPAEPWVPASAPALGLALKKYPELVSEKGHQGREWRISDPAGVN
jgi:DNA segregation ATPase FtsK/SpoIIIE-like protein